MRTIIITLILLMTIGLSADVGPTGDEIIIKDIKIYGTEHTRVDKLIKIISIKIGDPFTAQIPKLIEKRLENLKVFDSIEIEQRRIKREVILIISLKEKALFSIGPEIAMNAVDPDYITEENENNFFGVGTELTDYSLGRKSFNLDAGLGSQDRITLRFSKRTSWYVVYGLETGYNHFKTSLSPDPQLDKIWLKPYILKDWNHFRVKLWGEYSQLWEDQDNTREISKYWRLGASAVLDFRDHPLFPKSGVLVSLGAYRTWSESQQLYDAMRFSVSSYVRGLSKKHSLAVSMNGYITSGEVPMLNRISEGGYKTIRGISAYEQVYNNGIYGSIEYRIPIGNFDQNKPMFFASSLYLFSDFGLFSDQVRTLSNQALSHASGLGFLWQTDKDRAIRFDLTLYPKVKFSIGTAWKF